MKRDFRLLLYTALVCSVGVCSACAKGNGQDDTPIRIGIAWRGDSTSISYTSALLSVRMAGAIPVPLPLLKSPFLEYDGDDLSGQYMDEHGIVKQEYADKVKADPFAGQDIAGMLDGLDGLIFTGGADIGPTFYRIPEPWHGIEAEGNCDGRRDVSDYILMSWCLEREPQLPVLCICRGMQMLCVVSGAQMIQDLPSYFAAHGLPYDDVHRIEAKDGHGRDFAVHDVAVIDHTSLLQKIVGGDIISCVPSWHHQAVRSVEGTSLKVTAVTRTDGLEVIEAVERTDKPFFIGIQYHPEVAVAKHVSGAVDASRFMDYDDALRCFSALVGH